jgi:diguanylate cyclase (GGDEF)-like protein
VNLQRRIDHLETELGVLTTRFEALMETAANLVSADDIEGLLATILDHAAATVRAPQYVLAVLLRHDDALHVHQRGVEPDRIRETVADVTADRPDDRGGSRLVVDIASRARHYGRIAAIYPDEASARFLPGEYRLLQAYAAHAAAALDASHARHEADQRSATARALLELATSLSQVTTQHDVIERVADAVPSVVGCDSVCIMLWHPHNRTLQAEATRGVAASAEAKLRARGITEADVPNLREILAVNQPLFASYEQLGAPVQALFGLTKPAAVAVMPISHGDELLGVVAVADRKDADRLRNDPHVRERLKGMAYHAATALLNAKLIERIRHQALHDGLTELANRLLLQDHAEQSVARARRNGSKVALVFVDLDGFKAVNDRFGHATGDRLLIEVAGRLQRIARASDTVARVGGDEFALLVTDITDRSTVDIIIARVRRELDHAYIIDDQDLDVSASIGVAFMKLTDNYQSLLHRADLAMYDAKRTRPRNLRSSATTGR